MEYWRILIPKDERIREQVFEKLCDEGYSFSETAKSCVDLDVVCVSRNNVAIATNAQSSESAYKSMRELSDSDDEYYDIGWCEYLDGVYDDEELYDESSVQDDSSRIVIEFSKDHTVVATYREKGKTMLSVYKENVEDEKQFATSLINRIYN